MTHFDLTIDDLELSNPTQLSFGRADTRSHLSKQNSKQNFTDLRQKVSKYSDSTWEEIASKLVDANLLLTALELHTELLEVGKPLKTLKNFFSNPGNFLSSLSQPSLSRNSYSQTNEMLHHADSLSTLDSVSLARYSEDGGGNGCRDADEKVSVLEFELRRANETINNLKNRLTELSETSTNILKSSSPGTYIYYYIV